MTNDAKLGMLVGVIGVVFAAAFLVKPAPPATGEAQAQQAPTLPANTPSASGALANAPPVAPPDTGVAALPSTPVVRKSRDVEAKPTSRQATYDDEP